MSENGENAIWLYMTMQFNFAVSEMLKSGSNIINSEVANMSTIKLERWDSKHGLNLIKPLIKHSQREKRCFKVKKKKKKKIDLHRPIKSKVWGQ